jgi:hypothetical protein
MRIEELVVLQPDGLLSVPFHHRMSVLTGLAGGARADFVEMLHRAMNGTDGSTELRYRDDYGRPLLVRRTGGRRRVSAWQRGGAGDLPLPGPADLPRLTQVKAVDLGFRTALDGSLEAPSVPQLIERLIGWMGRARNAGGRGQGSLAIMDEPIAGLAADATWDLLDALDRLADMVQVVYLTEDRVVEAWAEQSARNDRVAVTPVASAVR